MCVILKYDIQNVHVKNSIFNQMLNLTKKNDENSSQVLPHGNV